MNFFTTHYKTTADNAPAGRAAADAGAARYKDAAAGTEGPTMRHVGMQTVARATTLDSASPSRASSTTSLRDTASTEPTSVSARNTPAHAASEAPKRPSSPPVEDTETTSSPPAAPVDMQSFSVPALHHNPRFRRALMRAAASSGLLQLSPASSARFWSVRPPQVNRISAPAHAAHAARQSGTDSDPDDAGMDDDETDEDDTGMDDDETAEDDTRDSDGEDEDGPMTPSQSALSPSMRKRIPLEFTEHEVDMETFCAGFARKRAYEQGGTGSQS